VLDFEPEEIPQLQALRQRFLPAVGRATDFDSETVGRSGLNRQVEFEGIARGREPFQT